MTFNAEEWLELHKHYGPQMVVKKAPKARVDLSDLPAFAVGLFIAFLFPGPLTLMVLLLLFVIAGRE